MVEIGLFVAALAAMHLMHRSTLRHISAETNGYREALYKQQKAGQRELARAAGDLDRARAECERVIEGVELARQDASRLNDQWTRALEATPVQAFLERYCNEQGRP